MSNSELIASTIEQINRERESAAAQSTRRCIMVIIGAQDRVRIAEAALAKLRLDVAEEIAKAKAELAAITIEHVNAADIVG